MEDQEEALVQQGEAAEMLLDSDAFSNTINQLVDASFQTFSNTAALEKEKRETAYHHYRALVDIVSTLRQRVQVKDEIVNKSADDSNQPGGE
jgi:hypothetical protein